MFNLALLPNELIVGPAPSHKSCGWLISNQDIWTTFILLIPQCQMSLPPSFTWEGNPQGVVCTALVPPWF